MNYDDWKLSNPIDDGYGYDMVSNCCGARLDESEERCELCGEGCVAIEDYEYKAARKEAYAEMMADGERDEGL
tara:strand:+ start:3219 stop:3437 length:219 start_codon:yes stop_codon:yes gene_type:complete